MKEREEKVHTLNFHFNVLKSQIRKKEIGDFFLTLKSECRTK